MSGLDLFGDPKGSIETLIEELYADRYRGDAYIFDSDDQEDDFLWCQEFINLGVEVPPVYVHLRPSSARIEVHHDDLTDTEQNQVAADLCRIVGLSGVEIATGDNYDQIRTYKPASGTPDTPSPSQKWREGGKDLLDALNEIEATPTVRLVALALLLHQGKGGEMWPSYSTLERYTGLARSTVAASVGWLIDHRVIKRTREARRESNEPARYRLTPTKGWKP